VTGIVHDKWQAKVSINKAKKESESKLAKRLKRTKIFFFAYARVKSKREVKVGSLEDSQGDVQ